MTPARAGLAASARVRNSFDTFVTVTMILLEAASESWLEHPQGTVDFSPSYSSFG
jgi:hypothetical protein